MKFQKLQKLYFELENEIKSLEEKARCYACGACCNFKLFEHTPFITALELENIQNFLDENKVVSDKASSIQDADFLKILQFEPASPTK